LGYDPEELLGKTVEKLIESDDIEDVADEMATKYERPLATSDLKVVFKVNEDSTIFEKMKSQKFSIYAEDIWDVSD
jgi:hypothetical protein